MIRINLLPVRQVRKVQAGQRQLMIFALALMAAFAIMFIVYEMMASEVERRARAVRALDSEIAQLKKEVGDFDRLKNQRDQLLAQARVINELHAGRSGPVRMLRELSDILSTGKGPTVDRDQYQKLLARDRGAGFNPDWNPRRLWIDSLDEKSRAVAISGAAKDHDDVAELLKRLTLSQQFVDVQLGRNDQAMDPKGGFRVVRFSLSARVKY